MSMSFILDTLGPYKDIKTYKFDYFYVFNLTSQIDDLDKNLKLIARLRLLIKGLSEIHRNGEPYKSILDRYEKLTNNYWTSRDCEVSNFVYISKDLFFSDTRFRLSDAECTAPLSEAIARLLGVFDIDSNVLDILRRS